MGYVLVGSGWHYRTLQTDSTEVNFPTVLKVENPKSGYSVFAAKPLSLACRQPSSQCPHVAFPLCMGSYAWASYKVILD